jgi:hypothetical protein
MLLTYLVLKFEPIHSTRNLEGKIFLLEYWPKKSISFPKAHTVDYFNIFAELETLSPSSCSSLSAAYSSATLLSPTRIYVGPARWFYSMFRLYRGPNILLSFAWFPALLDCHLISSVKVSIIDSWYQMWSIFNSEYGKRPLQALQAGSARYT